MQMGDLHKTEAIQNGGDDLFPSSRKLFSRAAWLSCHALFCLIGAEVTAHAADAPQDSPAIPSATTPPITNPEPTLRIGVYFGALSNQALRNITVLRPWATRLRSDYLVDAHAIYTAYRFDSIPLDLEIEGGIAKRIGGSEAGHEWEFDLSPMVRWKYWPWNDYLYTNFRLGLFGASYVTGVSAFERNFDSSHHGSRFLNFLVPEFTFAPSKDSPFEVFVRVHHRSGGGWLNGVHGGSNYVSAGVRFTAF